MFRLHQALSFWIRKAYCRSDCFSLQLPKNDSAKGSPTVVAADHLFMGKIPYLSLRET